MTKMSWKAKADATIKDQDDQPALDARVRRIWSVNGVEDPGFCVTDESGSCEVILSKLPSNINGVSFDVTDIFVEGPIYDVGGSGTHVDMPR